MCQCPRIAGPLVVASYSNRCWLGGRSGPRWGKCRIHTRIQTISVHIRFTSRSLALIPDRIQGDTSELSLSARHLQSPPSRQESPRRVHRCYYFDRLTSDLATFLTNPSAASNQTQTSDIERNNICGIHPCHQIVIKDPQPLNHSLDRRRKHQSFSPIWKAGRGGRDVWQRESYVDGTGEGVGAKLVGDRQ